MPIATVMGTTVFCRPMNQPLTAMTPSWAGAAQTQMVKYREACAAISASGAMTRSRSSRRGTLKASTAAAIAPAMVSDLRSTSRDIASSPAPQARAESPVVPMRRNPHSQ